MAKRKQTPVNHHRNIVRGVLSAAKSTAFAKRPRSTEEIYRSGLRRALMDARSELRPDERLSFLDWFDLVTRHGADLIDQALAFELLGHVLPSARISVPDEFAWLARRLGKHLGQLRAFRVAADELSQAFWTNDRDGVEACLVHIEENFGESLWLIETRIAVAQFYGGLESQKKYVSHVRKAQRGLPAYFAHFVSIRNEDRSTLRLFRDDFCRRVQSAKLPAEAKTYLEYRIGDVFSPADATISAILRVEQGQSIIDVYETVIDILQKLVKSGSASRYERSLISFLDVLSSAGDFRVDKLRLAMGLAPSRVPTARDCGAAASLVQGDIAKAYRLARKAHRSSPNEPWPIIECALCLSGKGLSLTSNSTQDSHSLRVLLAAIISRSEEFESASRVFEKFCRNFHTLPTAAALSDFATALLSPASLPPHALAAPALNSASLGPEDIISASLTVRETLPSEVSEAFAVNDCQLTRTYLPALLCSRDGQTERGYELARALDDRNSNAATQTLYSNLVIGLSLELGELDEAIVHIASEVASREVTRSILPVEEALSDRPWSALGQHPDKLALALCLEVYWRRSNDDLRATHLRFAFEDYMAATGQPRPSLLPTPQDATSPQLIYFLRFVCLPAVMDQAGILLSSRELSDERIAICEKLVHLDPPNAAIYNDEILEIRRALLIQDGMQIVDSSRIHVDTSAISRWAERRYSESFARYEALVKAGIGVADDLDELLRTVHRSPEKTDQFTIPDNEADALLLEMVIALADQFLNDPEHGLHFYLGKRIRHGTITGHLRGPLEISHLTTQRASEHGNYLPNTHWLDQLSFSSEADRERADNAFRQFAARYDDLTIGLKDRFLHVRSKEHPEGIFSITVPALAFNVVRSTLQTSLSFSNFLLVCYSFFWVLLTPSLSQARHLLEQESKSSAVGLFDDLQERLRTAAIQDANYLALSTAIRETSVSVQKQFDAMADWFRRTEAQQASHLFTLTELVDIAVQSALKTHKGFSPNVSTSVDGDIRASSAALVTVADIVFVVIDNACRRAESGSSPDIRISCAFKEATETLEFFMTNPVGENVDRARIEGVLEKIRDKIRQGDIRVGAQSDRGSGLMQIASITRQSPRGDLQFGFIDDNTFFTKVILSAVLKDRAIAVALEGAER
jgi:tetratricopeptide (TPR) repeat protein